MEWPQVLVLLRKVKKGIGINRDKSIKYLITQDLSMSNSTVAKPTLVFILCFLPARRYASAGNSDRNVSVRLSVRPSVRHAPVLCQNEES